MKKNMLTILILAATLVNVTLSAVCVFVTVPANRKVMETFNKLVIMLDLETQTPIKNPADPAKILAKDKTTYTYEESDMRIKLYTAAGEKATYISLKFGIMLNMKAKDYADTVALLDKSEIMIKDAITGIFNKYTTDEVNDITFKDEIRKEIVTKIQEDFGTDTILEIVFSEYLT